MASRERPPLRQYGGEAKAKSLGGDGDVPSAEDVERAHRNSDLDARAESQHHTLGPGDSQAAKGTHRHRGGDSLPLLDDMTITGDISDGTVLPSIIACLVALGATDSSTA